MKRLYDQFTQTGFYREREAAILQRLQKAPLSGPALPGANNARLYDPCDVIYYAGCVAGSLGMSLDGDNVAAYLTILKNHSLNGEWPEVARLTSELYARANEETIALIKADPVLAQQPWALLRTGQKSPSSEDFVRCAYTSDESSGSAAVTLLLPPV